MTWAAELLKVPCVQLLLEAGADVNIVDTEGQSAGHTLPLKELNHDVEVMLVFRSANMYLFETSQPTKRPWGGLASNMHWMLNP